VILAPLELLDRQGQRVQQDLQVRKVFKVKLALQVQLVRKEFKVQQDLQAPKVFKVKLALLAQLVRREFKV
jgi:hypothetical protein